MVRRGTALSLSLASGERLGFMTLCSAKLHKAFKIRLRLSLEDFVEIVCELNRIYNNIEGLSCLCFRVTDPDIQETTDYKSAEAGGNFRPKHPYKTGVAKSADQLTLRT